MKWQSLFSKKKKKKKALDMYLMSSLVFSEKKKINFRILSAAAVIGALKVGTFK